MLTDREDTARFERPEAGKALVPGPKEEGVLTVLRGPNTGALFTLDGPRALLGRSGEAHVYLADPALSRRHACIARTPSGFVLEDLGSTNGTFLDGRRLTGPSKLEDGARIELGEHTTLRFGLHDALEQEAARRTYELMVRDPLTRAFNRRHLEDRLQSEIAFCNRHNSPLSLLLVDLDDFKHVNDSHGHEAGDAVLRVISDALLRMTRTEDIVARYGGEEFVVVARGIDRAAALTLGERIRNGIARLRIPSDHGPLAVTVSIGVAHDDGQRELEAAALLRDADQAMYAAKHAGKDRVALAPPPLPAATQSLEPETLRSGQ